MAQENIMEIKEGKNEVTLEGKLLEIDSFEGTTGDGREYLSATLTVETGESEQVNIELFSMKLTNSGAENSIYKSLRTVVDEYKSVAKVGKEEADIVRVEAPTGSFNNGTIGLNDYVGGDGQLRSFPQINATFVNRVDKGEEVNPHAKFAVEILVDRIIEEFDKEENETGRVILHGYIPQYGGKVIPFEFKVSKDGSGYVQDNYERNDTVFVCGDIINKSERIVTKIETAFGADKEEVKYKTLREFVVTGGTDPYDEGDANAYDPEVIRKALVQREVYLEELKEKHEKKQSGGEKKGGFDTREKTKKREIKDIDLPF